MFYGDSRPSGNQYSCKARSVLSAVKVNDIDDSLEVSLFPFKPNIYFLVVRKLYRERWDSSYPHAFEIILQTVYLCVSLLIIL